HAQSTQQPCGFRYSETAAVWSPDCRAYFVNGGLTVTTRHSVVISGRFSPMTVRVVHLRPTSPVISDPTEAVRGLISHGSRCVDLTIGIAAVKWVGPNQLLVQAATTCNREQRKAAYIIDAFSGRVENTAVALTFPP